MQCSLLVTLSFGIFRNHNVPGAGCPRTVQFHPFRWFWWYQVSLSCLIKSVKCGINQSVAWGSTPFCVASCSLAILYACIHYPCKCDLMCRWSLFLTHYIYLHLWRSLKSQAFFTVRILPWIWCILRTAFCIPSIQLIRAAAPAGLILPEK